MLPSKHGNTLPNTTQDLRANITFFQSNLRMTTTCKAPPNLSWHHPPLHHTKITPQTTNNSHKGEGGPTEAEAEDLHFQTSTHIQFYHFHGNDSDLTTNYCPEKKKTLETMDAKKKNKLISHTSLSGQSCYPTFAPTPAFNYHPYLATWQTPTTNSQRAPS